MWLKWACRICARAPSHRRCRQNLVSFDSAKLCGLEPSQAALFSILPSTGAEAIQAASALDLLGESVKGRVGQSWGYVALPHEQILTVDENKARTPEHLDTEDREKFGPLVQRSHGFTFGGQISRIATTGHRPISSNGLTSPWVGSSCLDPNEVPHSVL